MIKIGIITYHAPYNFGSTLQAYATQEKLKSFGYAAEIVNYRMLPQKEAYSLIRKRSGKREFLLDLEQFPVFPQKRKRGQRFEKFFISYLNLTEEFADPEQFLNLSANYNVMISGSDQIWNKESNELHGSDWKYMMPYLLNGFNGKKVSYASSIGNSTQEDLRHIAPYISSFDHISMREDSSAEIVSKLLDRDVETVIDPTLLLTCDEWIQKLGLQRSHAKKPYVLFYSLTGFRPFKRGESLLKKIADQGYQVKFITPYFNYPWHDKRFVNAISYGPVEFIKALYNAETIITDSFHGTIFSINMGKKFYSINGQNASDFRKTDILTKLGLMSRSITWDTKYDELDKSDIDYQVVYERLAALREHSINYLKDAIEN